ncbi:integrase domain-containing protein [Vibrio breoganii]|uniref:integrase domain-containing protein n=1 Tax=Vibrio breoganii TaxID=553239 RepID=UPI000C8614ED|nr:integrase domain-containing protein [Vibrio breoganii]PMG93258.1 hypothetical protein BCU80_08480 [Vibrio breoganii]
MKKPAYQGQMPPPRRKFDAPNFGLASRDPAKGLINASLEETGGMKNNTHLTRLPACREFGAFLKQHTEVFRLHQITREHVKLFGEHLRERFETEIGFSASTARDYLSHINVCLAQARGDSTCKVFATKDLDYPSKQGIALKDRSVTPEQHALIAEHSSSAVSLISEIQRALGLRFREAALLDCTQALHQAEQQGGVQLTRGTKGGQPRTIPIQHRSQIRALTQGHHLQRETGHDNAIPEHLSFKNFQSQAWREVTQIDPTYRSHGERKYYACQFYESALGVKPPVVAGIAHGKAHHAYIAQQLSIDIKEAQHRDAAARLALSKVLGHHRLSITNAYLG